MTNNITASYVISGKKNSKKNPATISIAVKNNEEKIADINLVYENKEWKAASKDDLFNFLVCISGGAPVSRLTKYIECAWLFGVRCANVLGEVNPHKWDIVKTYN